MIEDLNFHRRLSVAPMLDFTDRHERYLLRLLSKNVLLYTEMVVANALKHSGPRFLQHDPVENPVALQLGGSDPETLSLCAEMAEDSGFDEVNLNCGCPSERVQSGDFGAVLMKRKNLVAECILAMKKKVRIPVTVKTRIGVDEFCGQEFLEDFVRTLKNAGADAFIIHARTARLRGYTPKENREKPKIQYEAVYELKRDFPQCSVSVNGDVKTLADAAAHLQKVDGVMMGRAVYANPWILATADSEIFGVPDSSPKSRKELLERYVPYVERASREGVPLSILTKHLLGLFTGMPGGKAFRRLVSEKVRIAGDVGALLREAMSLVEERIP